MIKELLLADIRIDGNTQQRPIDDDVVLRYKGLIEENPEKFPEIVVVFDGTDYFLADGFHRWHAYRKLGKKMMPVEVVTGSRRDAIWYSFSVNSDHGFPRQPGTVKKMLLEKIFPDEEWSKKTDAELAKWIGGVTRQYVSKCRQEWENAKNKTDSRQDTSNKAPRRHSGQTESPKDNQPENEASSDAEPNEGAKVVDSTGHEVPEHLKKVFGRVGEIKEHNKLMSKMFKTITEGVAANDPLYANCKLEQLKAAVSNVRSNLRFTIPYAVCPYCGGDVNNGECRACNSLGFVNESGWIATSQEYKDMR